ncbi:hypothetical protein CWC12_01025 [Pseudoalteromonas ruthenica]|nr:hypothetical protein CWC12_01025 [Pseudoalteromonas ruthenica]TMP23536.1 hypothetical protein CWC06_09830 [Pseudoalteromonas ruthenica]
MAVASQDLAVTVYVIINMSAYTPVVIVVSMAVMITVMMALNAFFVFVLMFFAVVHFLRMAWGGEVFRLSHRLTHRKSTGQ